MCFIDTKKYLICATVKLPIQEKDIQCCKENAKLMSLFLNNVCSVQFNVL